MSLRFISNPPGSAKLGSFVFDPDYLDEEEIAARSAQTARENAVCILCGGTNEIQHFWLSSPIFVCMACRPVKPPRRMTLADNWKTSSRLGTLGDVLAMIKEAADAR